jgi:hypothetical protein
MRQRAPMTEPGEQQHMAAIITHYRERRDALLMFST